ncbi:NHLP bacteriocin system secretion protein [Pseudodesulfovibrio sp.]|uniref:NHLP bacteriocin system secretion protein n=1 Tax=unclassified Pseudodesulfovibrio TaxID=2661612 RepID=UPI003AFF7DFE
MSDKDRKRSGNPLASPEELSRRITIVDAKGKFAVLTGIVLAVVLIGWSVFGSVPEMVMGTGILVPPDGLMDVVALGQGQITEVDVAPGDTVSSGDILARVSMPELETERQSILAGLKSARLWTAERETYYGQTMEVQGKNNEERIRHLRFRMDYLQEYFNFLKQHVKRLDTMHKGYITPKEVETTRKNMQSVLADINDCKLKIADVQAADLDLKSKAEQDTLQSRKQETDLELSLESVERRLQVFTKVRSPYDGVVVDTGMELGDYVSPGMPVVTLRPVDSPLEASLLFPAEVGKKIKPGMVAYVYPSTASKEEYGCIYGLVSSVGEYPASPESLMKSIGSRQLVQAIMEQGVMIMVRVVLLRDPDTASGFKWSSSEGPEDTSIEAGTVCTGNVVLKRNRPIDLLFPKFSKMLGLSRR